MLSEYFLSLQFYAAFTLFFVIGLAFTSRWISNFKIAYISSKPLGLLIFGYLIWLLSSFKLLDFQSNVLIWLLFAGLTIGAVWRIAKDRTNRPAGGWTSVWRDILWVEFSWILIYLTYLWLRSYNAEIHGTERFMDMAFFNASTFTSFFPPIDPWRAGEAINYYYYGHYLFALLGRLAGIATNFGYTFSLGIIFSSAIMLSWAFVRRFARSNILASLAGFFAVISGTVAYALGVITSPAGTVYTWMKSTRLYEPSYIINEIPSYSFTVGDMHAHLLALPFFMLALTLIYDLFREEEPRYDLIFALAIVLGSLGIINPWDFVSLTVVVSTAVLTKVISSKKTGQSLFALFAANRRFIFKAAAIGIFAVILMTPFLTRFESGASGIGFAPSYAGNNALYGKQYPTPLHGWLGMWAGFLLICGLGYFAMRKILRPSGNYPVVLFVSSLTLLAGVELFFVRDVYSLANPPYFRANTVFKFGFHTWILLTFAATVLAGQLSEHYRKSPTKMKWALPYVWMISAAVVILALLGVYYPYQAINQFYLSTPPPHSLDGSLFLKALYPDDFETIGWIRNNMKGREVIVEAAGDSYSDHGRISVFTGSISPIQWLTHEWTWHFKPAIKNPKPGMAIESGWGKVSIISQEVKAIYETSDASLAREILKKFGVDYVYVGELERKLYPALNEQKFYELGKVVFTSGNSKLFKVTY